MQLIQTSSMKVAIEEGQTGYILKVGEEILSMQPIQKKKDYLKYNNNKYRKKQTFSMPNMGFN